MIMSLRDHMRLYGTESADGRKRQIASVDEHYQMIELGVAGESEKIAALITKHVVEWKPLFLAAISRASDEA
jgi:DNA-binding GntR family transcriptional regulator